MRRISLVAVAVLGIVFSLNGAVPLIGPRIAAAAPSEMVSEYMNNFDQVFAENLGYSEGQGWGNLGGIVVLDFGGQAVPGNCGPSRTDRGVFGFDNNFHCDSVVAGLVEAFSRGFYNGLQFVSPGSTTVSRITMGTSNNGTVDTTAGTQWGQWVQAANTWLTDTANNGGADYSRNVTIWGAIDVEAGFAGNNTGAKAFIDAFGAAQTHPIVNYGDCAGCPTTYQSSDGNPVTSTGWTLDDEWYDSWGAPPAWPLPEIYFTVNGMPDHWKSVSLYSVITKNSGMLQFIGSFTQYRKCQQHPGAPGCTTTGPQGQTESTLTALQGWTALFNSLQSDFRVAMTPSFSTDIRDAQ